VTKAKKGKALTRKEMELVRASVTVPGGWGLKAYKGKDGCIHVEPVPPTDFSITLVKAGKP
jgi:hypothetical protein